MQERVRSQYEIKIVRMYIEIWIVVAEEATKSSTFGIVGGVERRGQEQRPSDSSAQWICNMGRPNRTWCVVIVVLASHITQH